MLDRPKAQLVRRVAHEILDPLVAPLRFKSAGVRRGWSARSGDITTTIDLTFSPWNYGATSEPYEFTIDFAVSREGPIAGNRIFFLLSDDQRDELRQIQNLVVAKIPIDEDELSRLPPEWQADRLAQVAPRFAPYPPNVDVWFQYLDVGDVRRWMELIGRVIPSLLDRQAAAIDAL